MFVDDGRHHLIVHGTRYDVITAEPPPPNHAGVVNLYSREFYRLPASRLAPGGVITQWLPVGDERCDHGAHFRVRELEHLILIGSHRPLRIDSAHVADPALARSLQRTGIGDLDDILGSVLQNDAQLRQQTRGIAPVTDDLPSIQYPHENVRADLAYTTGLSLDPANAFALLGPETARRAEVAAAHRATASAVRVLP